MLTLSAPLRVWVIAAASFLQCAIFGMFMPLPNTVVADSYPTAVPASGTGAAFAAGSMTDIVVPSPLAVMLGAPSQGIVGWVLLALWAAFEAAGAVLRRRNAPDRTEVSSDGHVIPVDS